jgi:hypothetical protein
LLACGPLLLKPRFAWTAPLLPNVNPSRLALGWHGNGRAGLVPGSWTGITLSAGTGRYPCWGSPIGWPASGRSGIPKTGLAKSKALVRSPQTLRRQPLMFGQIAGVPSASVHFSRNWMTEVWSQTSEVTQPAPGPRRDQQ